MSVSPLISVPAELMFQLSKAAGVLAFAATGRFSVDPGAEQQCADCLSYAARRAVSG